MGMTLGAKLATDEQIQQLLDHPDQIFDFIDYPEAFQDPSEQSHWLDLDQSWEGLHFLFTNSLDNETPFPDAFLLAHNNCIGDVDVGYGPATAWFSADLDKIAAFLESFPEKELKARWNPDRAKEWEDGLGLYLTFHFNALKAFCQRALQQHKGMVLFLQ